jgi:protein-S-isoprenylcysteine O-methyltransferase Ste14
MSGRNIDPATNMAVAIVGLAVYLCLVPGLLFVAAGTLHWPMAWVYVGLLQAALLGSRLVVLVRSPDTLRERARFASSEGTPGWDRLLSHVVGLFGPAGMALVAGLDHRFGWSASVPAAVQILAALALAGGYGLAAWAMIVNPYFSSVARIQDDRGQVVVTTGPYRVVRHPSYAGALLAALAFPFMMGALWALLPGLFLAAALALRTWLEDRLPSQGLDGYALYAEHTRHRLVPGLW